MCFFLNDTANTDIYTYLHTLSRHDALPIWGRGEVDRQPLGRRSNHHIAIPGIAIAPRVTRKVERRPDLRGRRLRLFEIGLAVGEPRLEPVLPLGRPAEIGLVQIMVEQLIGQAEDHPAVLAVHHDREADIPVGDHHDAGDRSEDAPAVLAEPGTEGRSVGAEWASR